MSSPRHSPLALLLVLSAVAALLAGCGGDGSADAELPGSTCDLSIPIGTRCVAGDTSRVMTVFDGVDAIADVNDGFGGSLSCTEQPDVWQLCSLTSEGVLFVSPIEIPDGRAVAFVGAGLDQVEPIDLVEGQPVGVRYEGGKVTIQMIDASDGVIIASLENEELG